ncbi:hypothetical protein LZD49_12670 [Dyadobacter sp. CY261]|uniref:IPT/TIG domain-containing protein n=1 Tax=Dyadobacter sp. CY261 TaxID=2907203 RepID=UPI001F383C08|nr:IPT/TIG domain-containing protein [Dyadobacter sp. CY261]MCF0071327.1 hypothetical protein [Dyadobacter sp. CY261]
MNRFLLLLSASLILFFSCHKKQKETPEPDPEEIKVTPLTDSAFIQYIDVPGADKIIFDSTIDAYLITLQAGFTESEIRIQFKLYPGAYLTWTNSGSSTLINFAFKNKTPLGLQISSSSQQIKTYQFFVKHPGPLKASVDPVYDFRLSTSGACEIPYDLISGVGTVPESPDSKATLSATLTDDGTGSRLDGFASVNAVYFQNANPFKESSQLNVVLKFGDKMFELAKNRKFLPVRSLVYRFGEFPLFSAAPLNKQILISGNGFMAKDRYKVTVESDFLLNAVTVPATFADSASLWCTLPSSLPNGSYSVSIFQNDTLVNALIRTISSNDKEKAIGQIWLSQIDYPIDRPIYYYARKIVAERGGALYVNPFPAVLGRMYSAFDPTTILPDLQLKNAGRTVNLKADIRSDPSFADGSFNVYYGKYAVPSELSPGLYEARLLYPDQTVSAPFWSKIEVH